MYSRNNVYGWLHMNECIYFLVSNVVCIVIMVGGHVYVFDEVWLNDIRLGYVYDLIIGAALIWARCKVDL